MTEALGGVAGLRLTTGGLPVPQVLQKRLTSRALPDPDLTVVRNWEESVSESSRERGLGAYWSTKVDFRTHERLAQ